jgi:hypothetical protein
MQKRDALQALTLWVILVQPNSALFVARNDRELFIRKEKVGGSYAAPVRILRQNDKFVWIFLYVRPPQSAKGFFWRLKAARGAPGKQQTKHPSRRHRQSTNFLMRAASLRRRRHRGMLRQPGVRQDQTHAQRSIINNMRSVRILRENLTTFWPIDDTR